MNEQALIEGEAAQKKADLAMRQAETAAQKKNMGEANAQYQNEHKRLVAAGFPMTWAVPPLLKNVVLGTSTAQSEGLSISAENMQNSQKERARRNTPQMTCFGRMILTQRMLNLTQSLNHGQHKMRVMNN